MLDIYKGKWTDLKLKTELYFMNFYSLLVLFSLQICSPRPLFTSIALIIPADFGEVAEHVQKQTSETQAAAEVGAHCQTENQ